MRKSGVTESEKRAASSSVRLPELGKKESLKVEECTCLEEVDSCAIAAYVEIVAHPS